jgi:hypothetical protein
MPRKKDTSSVALFAELQPPKERAKQLHVAMPKSRRILEYIRSCEEGATCDEIEKALHFSHQSVSARIYEAEASKKIFPMTSDGETVKRATRSGKPAIVWVAAS